VRAAIITQYGGPEVLQMREVDDPAPAADEVVIDVAATAVNRADLLQRQGFYPPPPGASDIPGLECSGTITALGSEVAGWKVGDEVCALLAGGGYAERVAVPAGQLMHVPSGLSLVEAAALPEVACTVWSMVFGAHAGRLQPGESLLVHGGTSGIGTMAVQLAKQRGAIVLTTVGSDAKAAAVRALGADYVINYKDEDFAAVAAGIGGADVVLDIVGAKYLQQNLKSLATGGRLIVLGMQGGVKGELDLGMLIGKRATIHAAGLRARSAEAKAQIVTETEHVVWPLVESGAIKPVIDRVLPLAEAAAAHEVVAASTHIGKVLLQV
jgi:putative PIG3 family NAD(P)H quinone oxidoreductase